MRFITKLRRFWRSRIMGQPLRRRLVGTNQQMEAWKIRHAERRRRSPYTGRDSGTRARILEILADGQPKSRKDIEAQLDVTTASIHLPWMVRDGLLDATDGPRHLKKLYWLKRQDGPQPPTRVGASGE